MNKTWCVPIVCLILLAVTVLGAVGSRIETSSSQFCDMSIVKVVCDQGHGSGFIVGPNTVVTARHVAEMQPSRIRLLDGEEYNVLDIETDPDSDAAKLTVSAEFPESLCLQFDLAPRAVGDRVVSIGYLRDWPLTRRKCLICAVDCEVQMPSPWTNTNLDMIDRIIGPGPSGSPILLNNRVVGIYVIYNFQSGVSFYVPAEEFVDDLNLR